MNALIRLTREDDAPALPDIERSSGEAFRTVPELAWIADDDVQSVASHLEFVRSGLSWLRSTIATARLDFFAPRSAMVLCTSGSSRCCTSGKALDLGAPCSQPLSRMRATARLAR